MGQFAKNPNDWMRACLPDVTNNENGSIYLDRDPNQYTVDDHWRDAFTVTTKAIITIKSKPNGKKRNC